MSQFLPYLLLLVCPLTMGLMMWVMMRGMGQDKPPDPRIAELQSQVNELRSAVSRGERQEAGVDAADSALTPRH